MYAVSKTKIEKFRCSDTFLDKVNELLEYYKQHTNLKLDKSKLYYKAILDDYYEKILKIPKDQQY